MSSTDRQTRLLAAEDWKRVYQSFKFADFKSYDFDNLRRTMIDYLRTNYPEDFNDYIESSEYLALIDMIAFLGQNISFRVDLNARENFIELAERRESVLRLARLLSYSPKRNQAAHGLLKFTSVSTTENVVDSNANNLSGRSIVWNDPTNRDWFEQFVRVLNSAMLSQNKFGQPVKFANVANIPTEQYSFNLAQVGIPVYGFSKAVNSQALEFEAVSTGIKDAEIIEESPTLSSSMNFLYRDNSQGPASANSGFFVNFVQGQLQRGEFVIDSPVPNQRVDIDAENINQTDVWLYKLDSSGNEQELWTQVEAVEGNNVVYNSLNKGIKTFYSVVTRINDRISLRFSDGVFGNLPKGTFRIYYRTSVNRDFTVLPANINNVSISLPYVSNIGRAETLTINLDLKSTVSNASSAETSESIKDNAPSTYYTQNRLITGEDYNVGPLGVSQDIIKSKAVNRTASGINRNYDLVDATGKYSNTRIFGTDGVIYKEDMLIKEMFSFVTRTDIEGVIENRISSILKDKNIRNFYLDNFTNQKYNELSLTWSSVTTETNRSTGKIVDSTNIASTVGSYTESTLRFLESGAMAKFIAPDGYHFMPDGTLMVGSASHAGSSTYKWTKIISIYTDGKTNTTTGLGPITLNDKIPHGAILSEIKPKFVRTLTSLTKVEMIDQIFSYKTFGLRYDRNSKQWDIILQDDLNLVSNFSTASTGDTTSNASDSSWILLFETNGSTYDISYRSLRYIFESNTEVKFFFDQNKKIYDSKTGKIIKDTINVLSINTDVNALINTSAYTTDFNWEISKSVYNDDGYINNKKLEIAFSDSDDDGVVDDIDLFEKIVKSTEYVFTKKITKNNSESYSYVDQTVENIIVVADYESINTLTENNPVFYTKTSGLFYNLNSTTKTLTDNYNYNVYTGRSDLKFQYIHATDENARIDPSSTNIIDMYLLTKQYNTNYRLYLSGVLTTLPLPPSSDLLYRTYSTDINKIKSISDELIYHPVVFKPLFGKISESKMQAVFKVVKNNEKVTNDNDLKSQIITAIDQYFSLTNWDFGETFYWGELSAYIMQQLATNISNIVIVPRDASSYFGSLQEIRANADEIFISAATVDDVEIVTAITTDRLKAEGVITTTTSQPNLSIQSGTTSTTASSYSITSNSGGFVY